VAWLADKLRVDESDIDPRRSFADHGVDSLAAAEFAKALADRMSIALDETLLWNFPTIDALLEYLERAPQDADGETSSAQQPSVDRRAAPPASSTQAANVADELTLLERELKKRS
jgi:acyl carrier protein